MHKDSSSQEGLSNLKLALDHCSVGEVGQKAAAD
jgi:hypothetical protein